MPRAVEVKQQASTAHVSFQFMGLDDAEVERLDAYVFDTVLAQLQGALRRRISRKVQA